MSGRKKHDKKHKKHHGGFLGEYLHKPTFIIILIVIFAISFSKFGFVGRAMYFNMVVLSLLYILLLSNWMDEEVLWKISLTIIIIMYGVHYIAYQPPMELPIIYIPQMHDPLWGPHINTRAAGVIM